MSVQDLAHRWAVISLGALVACGAERHDLPVEPQFLSFASASWSEPVNLGPTVNTEYNELGARLSPDELSLYFFSDRPGGTGGNDLWVSRRACRDCPWGAPANLTALNSGAPDGGPGLSLDGTLLFFHSGRPGGAGGNDIYVSRRSDPNDDFSWGPPTLLGPGVNTPDIENAPEYLPTVESGPASLYFNRGALARGLADLYVAPVARDGETLGPAVLVSELSVAGANDAGPTIRRDGREIYFWSNRAGAPGGFGIMVSTRQASHEPWSAPTFAPAPINSEFGAQLPGLSGDGRTLLFSSIDRPGGFGGNDIWMSTRTPSGR